MQEAGVGLHAITAESGGSDAVNRRLASRDTGGLPFPVHSDPDRKLCVQPMDGYYVTEPMDAGAKFGGDYVGVSYTMVQPAVEIVDRSGTLLQKWSWYSVEPTPDPMGAMTKVSVDGEEKLLVAVRPLSADIIPAIREGRNVRMSAVSF